MNLGMSLGVRRCGTTMGKLNQIISLKMDDVMGFWERKTVSMSRIVFSWINIFLIFIILSSCKAEKTPVIPFYNTPDFTPIFIDFKADINKKVTHKIDEFSFEDQNGEMVSLKDVNGKIHVANFMFTSCGSICPKMTSNMQMVSNAFSTDNDVVILSYSVMPWVDTVEKLKEYTEVNNVKNENWHFLTGSKGKIYNLARKSYFAEEDLGFTKDSTDFLHTEHFILVDENLRIRGIYNGTLQTEMKQLVIDIKLLKLE